MKQLLFVIICFLSFSISPLAQTSETFDIATFQPPKGWIRQSSPDSVRFSTEDKSSGAYCLITLLKSLPGPGDSKENFAAAWQLLVKGAVTVGAPEMLPSDNPEDWALEGGLAPFEKDGEKGVALLYTISGYGKMVNIMILTNTRAYEANLTAFVESINLKKPEAGNQVNANAEKQQQQITGNGSGSQPSLTQFHWKQSQSRKDNLGGYAGYSRNTYEFYNNNTYKFSRVDFQNYTPKYYLEDEEGTYKITGNKITITPKKAVFHSHKSKKEDPALKSGNLGLTTVQYVFEIIDLNNNWTLLLSPVDGTETKRDGTFSFWLNGEPRKSYSYNSVNAQGELIR